MIKKGVSMMDKQKITSFANQKMKAPEIAKALKIDEKVVANWMPEAVAKRAKKAK